MTEIKQPVLTLHEPVRNQVIANLVPIMETRCVHCSREIQLSDGIFYVMGSPYHACIHRNCAPFFQYRNVWPHTEAWDYYDKRSQIHEVSCQKLYL